MGWTQVVISDPKSKKHRGDTGFQKKVAKHPMSPKKILKKVKDSNNQKKNFKKKSEKIFLRNLRN